MLKSRSDGQALQVDTGHRMTWTNTLKSLNRDTDWSEMWVLLPMSKVATRSTKRTAAIKYRGFVCICFTETQRLVQYMYHANLRNFVGFTSRCWQCLQENHGQLKNLQVFQWDPIQVEIFCISSTSTRPYPLARSKTGTGARYRLRAWKVCFDADMSLPFLPQRTCICGLDVLVEQALIPPAKHDELL